MGKKARFDRGYSMGFGRKGRTISVARSPSQDLRRKISVARSPSQNRYIGIFLPGMKPTSVPEVGNHSETSITLWKHHSEHHK